MDDSSPLPLDAETKVAERPGDHEAELRLWLRLLTCTTLIENEIRQRLRTEFDVTLPRFDLMAQLDKAPNGMTLGELSQRMMVSNGNVTGLVERLVSLNLVERKPAPNDRRAMIVTLTAEGRRTFRSLARTHEGWIAEIFARADPNRDRHADETAGQDQEFRAQGDRQGSRAMSLNTHHPVPLPLASYKAQHVKLAVERQARDADAEPAGPEKPADLRELCRDRRHFPRRRP